MKNAFTRFRLRYASMNMLNSIGKIGAAESSLAGVIIIIRVAKRIANIATFRPLLRAHSCPLTYPLASWNDNIAMANNMIPMMLKRIDAVRKRAIARMRNRVPDTVCIIARTVTPKGLFRALERFATIPDASFSSRGVILFVFCVGIIHLPERLIVAANYGRSRLLTSQG